MKQAKRQLTKQRKKTPNIHKRYGEKRHRDVKKLEQSYGW